MHFDSREGEDNAKSLFHLRARVEVKAEKEKQRTAAQMALVGRTVSVAPPAPPSLVSLSSWLSVEPGVLHCMQN